MDHSAAVLHKDNLCPKQPTTNKQTKKISPKWNKTQTNKQNPMDKKPQNKNKKQTKKNPKKSPQTIHFTLFTDEGLGPKHSKTLRNRTFIKDLNWIQTSLGHWPYCHCPVSLLSYSQLWGFYLFIYLLLKQNKQKKAIKPIATPQIKKKTSNPTLLIILT